MRAAWQLVPLRAVQFLLDFTRCPSHECLQRNEQGLHGVEVFGLARTCHQAETVPISGAIGHASVGSVFHNLFFGGGNDGSAIVFDLILPADQTGSRKPTTQLRYDFGGGYQLHQQTVSPRGEFSRLHFFHLTFSRALPDFAKSKIAYGGSVEDGMDGSFRKRVQASMEIGGGRKGLHIPGAPFTPESRLLTNQQRDRMPAVREEVGQFRSEPAGREIGQAPDLIQRFVSGSGSDDAIHSSGTEDAGWRVAVKVLKR